MCAYACLRSSVVLCVLCGRVCARGMRVWESPPRVVRIAFPHGEGTAHNPKQPPCDRPTGIAASPGAPMGGAPTPNVEIPLERSQAVRPTVLICWGAPLQLAGTESYTRVKPGANGPVDRIYSSQPNTLLWGGRTQQPQLFSRCSCVSDVLRLPAARTRLCVWISLFLAYPSDGEAG